jgi:RNA polymerase sigma factor (sigma-70 family)
MIDSDQRSQFSTVVTPHLSDAFTMALWLTGDRADAEDIVQEACLRAFRAIATYSGGSARAWVLTIVRNTAYSWLRKNRRAEFIAVDDLAADERELAERGANIYDLISADPESELIARADAARLRVAIERLPPKFREAIVLRDIQGLEYAEIAEVASIPLGTVMSRLARARRQLIAAIGQRVHDEAEKADRNVDPVTRRAGGT